MIDHATADAVERGKTHSRILAEVRMESAMRDIVLASDFKTLTRVMGECLRRVTDEYRGRAVDEGVIG